MRDSDGDAVVVVVVVFFCLCALLLLREMAFARARRTSVSCNVQLFLRFAREERERKSRGRALCKGRSAMLVFMWSRRDYASMGMGLRSMRRSLLCALQLIPLFSRVSDVNGMGVIVFDCTTGDFRFFNLTSRVERRSFSRIGIELQFRVCVNYCRRCRGKEVGVM